MTEIFRLPPGMSLSPNFASGLKSKYIRFASTRLSSILECGFESRPRMSFRALDLKLKDKIPCSEIRKRTKIIDIIEHTLKQKWKWAGHIARLEDKAMHRVATKEREEVQRTTKQKMAR